MITHALTLFDKISLSRFRRRLARLPIGRRRSGSDAHLNSQEASLKHLTTLDAKLLKDVTGLSHADIRPALQLPAREARHELARLMREAAVRRAGR